MKNITSAPISEAYKDEKIEQLIDPKGKFTDSQIAIKEAYHDDFTPTPDDNDDEWWRF